MPSFLKRRHDMQGAFPTSKDRNRLGAFPSAANENPALPRHRTKSSSADNTSCDASFDKSSIGSFSCGQRQSRLLKPTKTIQKGMDRLRSHVSRRVHSLPRSLPSSSRTLGSEDDIDLLSSQRLTCDKSTGYEELDGMSGGPAFDFTPLVVVHDREPEPEGLAWMESW